MQWKTQNCPINHFLGLSKYISDVHLVYPPPKQNKTNPNQRKKQANNRITSPEEVCSNQRKTQYLHVCSSSTDIWVLLVLICVRNHSAGARDSLTMKAQVKGDSPSKNTATKSPQYNDEYGKTVLKLK